MKYIRHYFVGFSLALALTVGLILPAYAANADKAAICMEYYDLLQEKIKNNGICEPSKVKVMGSTMYPDEPGILFAYVIDMDKDSLPELVVFESREVATPVEYTNYIHRAHYVFVQIYTSKDGKIVNVHDAELLSAIRYGFCKASDGRVYLRIEKPATLDTEDLFYGVDKGKIVEKKFARHDDVINISGMVNGEYVVVDSGYSKGYSYSINGKGVSVTEYTKQKKALTKTELVKYGTYHDRPTDDNVTKTIKELADTVPASFLDGYNTPSTWAQESVATAKKIGILPTSLQRKYNQPITRREFCELAVNYFERASAAPITALADFVDTDSEAVRKMGGLGIVGGIGDGKFAPDDYITREQAAVILVKLAEKLGGTIAECDPTFSDNASTSSWAFKQVGKIQAAGIMGGTGNNNFSPKAHYTREQSVLTILKLQQVQSAVTDVTLSHNKLTLFPGAHRTLTAEASCNGVRVPQTFIWSSSDSAVVSIDPNLGTITCHKPGTVIITATAKNATGQCEVKVNELTGNIFIDPSEEILVEGGMSDDISFRYWEYNTRGLGARFRPVSIGSKQLLLGAVEACVDVDVIEVSDFKYFYVDWELCDLDGNVVEDGSNMIWLGALKREKPGFNIIFSKVKPETTYQLFIKSYQPVN